MKKIILLSAVFLFILQGMISGQDPGDITIYMYSSPLVDIDFICWGPFANPHSPCVAGLTSGPPPLIVNFLDQSTGEPTSWKWDFQNDGTYDAFEQNPYFIYPEAGIYSVKLWAENQYEIDSIVYIDYITITEPDLLVQNPVLSPGTVFAGDTLFIAYDVMNQGNGDADQQLEESDEGNNVNLAIFTVDTATWIIYHDSGNETPGIRVLK